MAEDLSKTIRENAQGPAKATSDGTTVEQHKLTDQIAADKHLTSKSAASQRNRGLRFTKLVPPGAT